MELQLDFGDTAKTPQGHPTEPQGIPPPCLASSWHSPVLMYRLVMSLVYISARWNTLRCKSLGLHHCWEIAACIFGGRSIVGYTEPSSSHRWGGDPALLPTRGVTLGEWFSPLVNSGASSLAMRVRQAGLPGGLNGIRTETHEGSRYSVSIIPLGKICSYYPEPPKVLTKHMLTPSRPPKRTVDRAEDTAKPKELTFRPAISS